MNVFRDGCRQQGVQTFTGARAVADQGGGNIQRLDIAKIDPTLGRSGEQRGISRLMRAHQFSQFIGELPGSAGTVCHQKMCQLGDAPPLMPLRQATEGIHAENQT